MRRRRRSYPKSKPNRSYRFILLILLVLGVLWLYKVRMDNIGNKEPFDIKKEIYLMKSLGEQVLPAFFNGIQQVGLAGAKDQGSAVGTGADKRITGSRGIYLDPGVEEEEGQEEIYLIPDIDITDEIKIEISKIKDDLKPIPLSGEGPQVLVYHSHSREAYKQDPQDPYKVAEVFRTDDLDHTILKVGEVLTENLKRQGIPALHDETNHEKLAGYNSSYKSSLNTLNRQMEQNKTLKIFIDVHRDYFSGNTPRKGGEVITIDGERVARIRMVIGTGEGLVSGFKDKPEWKENYKFATAIMTKLKEKHPGMGIDILVKKSRYNQHVSTKAILVEIGSHLTTLEEAERAAKYLAEAISAVVEKN